ncbi:MAG TPA: hypothetical protein VHD62_13430 [Opitutaceae bacterium]|nr:hypothetical protein [Opitutaceae bacterium]
MPASPSRVKFIWGAARAIPGRWHLGLFGFFDRGDGRHRDGLAISVRGLLAWLGALACAGYVALATAVFWFGWQPNPYNLRTYGDALLYPVRRAAIAEKTGQAFIAQGLDLWHAKQYREGANLLRQGLMRYPHDFRARMTLAQYYFLLRSRPLALAVLLDGLTDEYPGRAYLQTLFSVAEQGEDFGLVVRLCERYRRRLPVDVALRDGHWLETREFAGLLSGGRAADALEFAIREGDGDTASEQRTIALLALGRAEDAVTFLAQWRARPDANLEPVVRLQVRAFREAKRLDEMEAAIAELRRQAPSSPAPAIYGIVQRAMAGRAEAARAALEDFIFRFGGTAGALQAAAEPLAEIGERALVERCAAAATERGQLPAPFQVLLVQASFQRGEWANAARVLAAMAPPAGRNAAGEQAWHDWAQRVVEAATIPADAAQLALIEFLRSRPWPMSIFRRSIEALRRAGRDDTARDALALARGAFPESAWLGEQETAIAHSRAEQQMQNAAPAAVAATVWTEKTFFARFDAAVQAAQWAEAAGFVTDVRSRKPPPPWLDRRDTDLRLAEIRIEQGRGRRAEMLTAAKLYLNGDVARLQRVLELAREFAGADKESALALTREVLRVSPDFPPARRLLAEWAPPPAPKK